MNLLQANTRSDSPSRVVLFEKPLLLMGSALLSVCVFHSVLANNRAQPLNRPSILSDFERNSPLRLNKSPSIHFEQLTRRSLQFQKKVEAWQKQDPHTFALAAKWLQAAEPGSMVKKLEQKFRADTGLEWYMVDHLELELRRDTVTHLDSWHWIVDGHELSAETIALLRSGSEQDQAYLMGMRRMYMIEDRMDAVFEEAWTRYEIANRIKLGNASQKAQAKETLIGQYMLESYFMEHLVGVTQDFGIAQISPQLAAYHGFETNLDLSLDQSLKVGIDYFMSGLARYQGLPFDEKLKRAVIHYNWGPGRVNQIQHRAGNVSTDVLVQHNPNAIQRNYLPAVQARVRWIRQHARALQALKVAVQMEVQHSHEMTQRVLQLLRRKIDLSPGSRHDLPEWFVAYLNSRSNRKKRIIASEPPPGGDGKPGGEYRLPAMPRWADRFSVANHPFFRDEPSLLDRP